MSFTPSVDVVAKVGFSAPCARSKDCFGSGTIVWIRKPGAPADLRLSRPCSSAL